MQQKANQRTNSILCQSGKQERSDRLVSKSSSGSSSQSSSNHNQSTGNQLNGGHPNAQSHQQQLNPHLALKGQQSNSTGNGQLPNIHDQLTGLTIKTNQAVAAANAILNCSPLSSTSASPLAAHSHLQSNLSASANSSPDSNPSSNSPSLANRTKDSKNTLTDCKFYDQWSLTVNDWPLFNVNHHMKLEKLNSFYPSLS